MKIAGKSALITGSSQGIGKEIALLMARNGCNVIITYRKEKEKAEETAVTCREFGVKADVFKLDITDDNSIDNIIKNAGTINILINNAGTGKICPFNEYKLADIELEFRTNVLGLMKLTRLSMDLGLLMVINIASGAGKSAYANMAVYCATKAAVRYFTMALGKENKIKAYCVNPGLTATQLTNYQGIAPIKVAEVVLATAKEEYGLPNGGEVDAWEKAV